MCHKTWSLAHHAPLVQFVGDKSLLISTNLFTLAAAETSIDRSSACVIKPPFQISNYMLNFEVLAPAIVSDKTLLRNTVVRTSLR